MSAYLIQGGSPLFGEVTVQGAKNSVLPILAATILTGAVSVLHNCPQLTDVDASVAILRHLGCVVVQDGETIPFCACVHTGDTTLYHDTESQVLLAELDYPAPVENAEQRYLGMETTDRNGDGSSDVLLRFSQEDGTLELLFCWDPETGTFRSVPA